MGKQYPNLGLAIWDLRHVVGNVVVLSIPSQSQWEPPATGVNPAHSLEVLGEVP